MIREATGRACRDRSHGMQSDHAPRATRAADALDRHGGLAGRVNRETDTEQRPQKARDAVVMPHPGAAQHAAVASGKRRDGAARKHEALDEVARNGRRPRDRRHGNPEVAIRAPHHGHAAHPQSARDPCRPLGFFRPVHARVGRHEDSPGHTGNRGNLVRALTLANGRASRTRNDFRLVSTFRA